MGDDLVSGLRTHVDDFPNPPMPPDDLEATLNAYIEPREDAGWIFAEWQAPPTGRTPGAYRIQLRTKVTASPAS